jgi:hypothetical protein
MASKHVQSSPKSKTPTSILPAVARVERLAVLGPPLLLEQGDDAVYQEVLARICAAVKPANVIEEIFVADVLFLQWEILGFRRLKSAVVRDIMYKAISNFLLEAIDYNSFADDYERALREQLEENIDEKQGLVPETLVRQFLENEPDATKKIDELLEATGKSTYSIYQAIKNGTVEQLTRSCVRGEPRAVKRVNKLVALRGVTVQDLVAEPLSRKMDAIERMDRLIASAETRRNASLREIDRRRAVLGQELRRSLEAADNDFEVIEATCVEGKDAA